MKIQCPECKQLFSGTACECGFVSRNSQKEEKVYQGCEECDFTGIICATLIKNRDWIRDYSFRCSCEKGQSFSQRIPDWNRYWMNKGFEKLTESVNVKIRALLKDKPRFKWPSELIRDKEKEEAKPI